MVIMLVCALLFGAFYGSLRVPASTYPLESGLLIYTLHSMGKAVREMKKLMSLCDGPSALNLKAVARSEKLDEF